MAKGKIEQEIALKVTGAKDVKEAARIVDELDGETATVKVGVDSDQGVKDVKAFSKLIEGLSDEDKTIVLKARADQAEREIKKLTGQIGRAKDAHTVQIKVEAIGNARAELERIRAEAKKLDAQDVDIDVKATGLDKVSESLGDLPGALGAVGSALRGLGTVGGIGALAAGGVALANNLADASLQAEVLARLTGDTIQNASRLQAVWKTTGADANDLADVLLQMNGVFADTPELARQVGVNLGDGATIGERFVEVVGLVQAGLIDSATQSKIFGEEGVRQVARLTSTYDDLGAAIDDVSDTQVFTPEERADLERFSASMTELKVAAADVGAEIGDRVVPVLQALFDAIDQAKEAVEWLDQRTPKGAREAGLSLSDIFSGPNEIAQDFRHNLDVILGQAPKIDAAFRQASTGGMSDAIEEGIDSTDRFIAALDRQLPAMIKAEQGVKSYIDAMRDALVAQQAAANEAAAALGGTQIALADMASSFNTMARREDAISAAFDLGNAPLEALETVTDINDAIRDLGAFIEEEGTPFGRDGLFDPDDVDAGPFLAKISSLRGPVQQAITGAFATGGAPAARATVDAYVKQITESMRGRLTETQVREMLGLTDIEATLKIGVDQESLATAEGMLEILTGLEGETPWTATIKLALAAGDISADAAKLLTAARLEELGADVPVKLAEPTQGSKTAAKAAADRFAADNPVDMQTEINDPSLRSLLAARNAGQDDADKMPIHYPSVVDPPRQRSPFRPLAGIFGFDGGGTVGPAGGIAGERGPEILNDRYLALGPTYVPPGTKVTSRRRTAVIYRHGLKRYDSGGIVGGVPTINVNFNGIGTIGNRADVDRQVRRSLQRIERIYGSR